MTQALEELVKCFIKLLVSTMLPVSLSAALGVAINQAKAAANEKQLEEIATSAVMQQLTEDWQDIAEWVEMFIKKYDGGDEVKQMARAAKHAALVAYMKARSQESLKLYAGENDDDVV